MDEHVDELYNSQKKQALANGRKRHIEPEEVRHEHNDRKRLKCDCYENCLQIKSGKVGTDLKLECACTCNIECMSECSNECMLKCNKECTGNKQWLGGHNETVLTYNSHVVKNMNVKILEQSAHNNSIIIKNATKADLNSVFTCSSGTLSKSINLDGNNEHESCLQIELHKVGTDLKLECECTCNTECIGNKQWTGGQNGTVLTFNGHPVDINRNIQILEQTAHKNFIIWRNPTQADLKSNCTCSFGKLYKSVSLNTYNEKSAQASPTISTDTATGGPNATTVATTGGPNVTTFLDLDVELGSIAPGYYLLVIAIAIFTITMILIYVWITKKPKTKEEEEEEEGDDLL